MSERELRGGPALLSRLQAPGEGQDALVGPEREVRLTAFNGPPRGVQDLPERFERPAKYRFASHAESNLVAFAAREGIRTAGCTVYTTHFPCSACARALIQAGIVCVVAGPGTTSMPAEEFEAARAMFAEAGVQAVRLACAPAIQNVPGTDGRGFPDRLNTFPDPTNEGGTGSRQELEPIRVLYRNWRGEIAARSIIVDPPQAWLWHGCTEWHPEPQVLLHATDADKGAVRDFALSGFLAWGDEAVTAYQALEAELQVLRDQRMGPERERELLEANSRLLERARAAEGRLRELGVDAGGAA